MEDGRVNAEKRRRGRGTRGRPPLFHPPATPRSLTWRASLRRQGDGHDADGRQARQRRRLVGRRGRVVRQVAGSRGGTGRCGRHCRRHLHAATAAVGLFGLGAVVWHGGRVGEGWRGRCAGAGPSLSPRRFLFFFSLCDGRLKASRPRERAESRLCFLSCRVSLLRLVPSRERDGRLLPATTPWPWRRLIVDAPLVDARPGRRAAGGQLSGRRSGVGGARER
jgi:hypothetical protein